jgi:hypothetical protein
VDKQEANAELSRIVAAYKSRSYDEWIARIEGEAIAFEVTAASGRRYQVEIQAVWDDREGGDVRVMFGIDDGGWRAFLPLTDSFIIRRDGTFVGE